MACLIASARAPFCFFMLFCFIWFFVFGIFANQRYRQPVMGKGHLKCGNCCAGGMMSRGGPQAAVAALSRPSVRLNGLQVARHVIRTEGLQGLYR